MKAFLIYVLLIVLSPLTLVAQSFRGCDWISCIDESRTVASLSIPGAHDAATGEGLVMIPGFGKTQDLSIAELWDCGVRAFDLRPAVRKGELHVYHSIIRTKVTFSRALEILCSRLETHPTEFAIVLMREENDSENADEQAMWPVLVGQTIRQLGEKAAVFSPSMTVGEARGKIIFISRNHYTDCDRGAFVTGWNCSHEGNLCGNILPYTNGPSARLMMQDYYDPTNSTRRKLKDKAALQFLDHAAGAPADVWTINFLSGYTGKWSELTKLVTTAAYKRNAVAIHPIIIDALANRKKSTGIVMMDFSGCDKSCGGILRWRPFRIHGSTLVNDIIRQNFI